MLEKQWTNQPVAHKGEAPTNTAGIDEHEDIPVVG